MLLASIVLIQIWLIGFYSDTLYHTLYKNQYQRFYWTCLVISDRQDYNCMLLQMHDVGVVGCLWTIMSRPGICLF